MDYNLEFITGFIKKNEAKSITISVLLRKIENRESYSKEVFLD